MHGILIYLSESSFPNDANFETIFVVSFHCIKFLIISILMNSGEFDLYGRLQTIVIIPTISKKSAKIFL